MCPVPKGCRSVQSDLGVDLEPYSGLSDATSRTPVPAAKVPGFADRVTPFPPANSSAPGALPTMMLALQLEKFGSKSIWTCLAPSTDGLLWTSAHPPKLMVPRLRREGPARSRGFGKAISAEFKQWTEVAR